VRRGARHERAGQRDALPLAARELARPPREHLLAADRPRGVLRGARLLGEPHDFDPQAGLGRGLRDAGDVAMGLRLLGHGRMMPRVVRSIAQPKSDRGARQR